MSAGTDPSAIVKTPTAIPGPDAEGFEDWIKARAAAVGVPVALEKERQAWYDFFRDFSLQLEAFLSGVGAGFRSSLGPMCFCK